MGALSYFSALDLEKRSDYKPRRPGCFLWSMNNSILFMLLFRKEDERTLSSLLILTLLYSNELSVLSGLVQGDCLYLRLQEFEGVNIALSLILCLFCSIFLQVQDYSQCITLPPFQTRQELQTLEEVIPVRNLEDISHGNVYKSYSYFLSDEYSSLNKNAHHHI